MLRWLRRLGFSCFLKLSWVLWGFLKFSLVFFGPIGLFRSFSDFLFFWRPFGVPLGTFGVPLCLSGSLWGPLGVPSGLLSGAVGPFGIPWGSPWGPFGVPLGSLWSLWGHLGCPGVPKDAENQKTHVFVCFCPCVKKHVFLCVSRSGQGSMHQNTCVFVCFRIFEAEVAPKQNIRIFVCF